MQIFVGGQNELTLVTLLQNSVNKITILGKNLVASIFGTETS